MLELKWCIQIYENKWINEKAEVVSFARKKEWEIMVGSGSWPDWIYTVIKFSRKHNNKSIHRIMWEAFLWLNPEDKSMCVLHNDETLINWRLDNSLSNLRLWTHLDNNLDCINKWRHKRKEVRVACFWLDWKIINVWGSSKEAGLSTGIDNSSIIKCCKGKLKSAWKLQWKYLPKKDSN